jgi:hypothetical protein
MVCKRYYKQGYIVNWRGVVALEWPMVKGTQWDFFMENKWDIWGITKRCMGFIMGNRIKVGVIYIGIIMKNRIRNGGYLYRIIHGK